MATTSFKGRIVSTANGFVNAQFDNTQTGAGLGETDLRGVIVSFPDPTGSVSQGAYTFSTSGGSTSLGYILFTVSQ